MTTVDNQTPGGSSSVSTYGYTYDALGRRGDRTQSGSAINTPSTDDFSYNSRSEVIASSNSAETAPAWNPTFAYDKIGNRKSSTGFQPVSAYTANALNQYTAIDAANPTHDLDGNLISDGGAWTYSWNNENRLTTATNGTTTLNFTYDYQGRLVKKDDGTDIEVYVYDGWNRIASFEASPSTGSGQTFTLTGVNVWGLDLSGFMQGAGGVGGLLKETINEQQTTTNLYPTYDANGNIMQKLDGTGAVVMSVDYDPFGNIINGTLVGEYGFSTKPLVEGILMYYYGFRYYDPVTGRWPSRDPIEEWGGINLYAAALNNLVNYIDRLGLSCCGSETLKSGNVCCDGTQYRRQRRKRCCGSSYIQSGNNAPCCVNGSPVSRVPMWENENYHSLEACIADNSKITSRSGLILGGLLQGLTKVLGKVAGPAGWTVWGITAADWYVAQSKCKAKQCPKNP